MKFRMIARVASLTLLGMTAACGGSGDGSSPTRTGSQARSVDAGESYTIGMFAPLTGFAAGDGESARTAAKLAVDMVNASGGVDGKTVTLKVYDDASKPDQAATLIRKMIQQDKVDVVVSGSYSAQTRAVAPVVAQANKLMLVGYAVDPVITAAGPSIWRVGELATIQGKVAGEVVTGKLGAKKVAILQVDNDFGSSLVSSFKPYIESKGAKVVYEAKYPIAEKDYRAVLASAAAANPDVIYAPGYYNNAADILKQAQETGVNAQIVGVEGYDSPDLIKLAGPAANGVIITTELNRDSDSEAVKRFIAAYEVASGGRPADAVAAEVYDATLIAMDALKRAGSNETDKLVSALKSHSNSEFAESVTGITGFDSKRNAIRPGLAQIVKNGEFHFYAKFTDPAVIKAE